MNPKKFAERLVIDRGYRIVTKAVLSLVLDLVYAFYNGILGILAKSPVFGVSALYYIFLTVTRFSAVIRVKSDKNDRNLLAGVFIVILGAVFPVTVFFSMSHGSATPYGAITMITIATYTFTKIILAVISALRHRGKDPETIRTINAIRYSEAAVSLFTMQQSMLVSFGDMEFTTATVLNACTGAGVCVFIITIGIITITYKGKR